MLLNLKINNFALIKESNINFKAGLNVLSGETGSGKSIIFEALAVCLGERANKSMIKSGTDHAVIEATFTINDEIKSIIKEKGFLSDPDDETIILRRDLYLDYPTVSRINGFSATLNDLKNISSYFCDIYGQFEHQLLLDADNYLGVIDDSVSLIDSVLYNEISNNVKDAYADLNEYKTKLANLNSKMGNLNNEIDYINFQIKEIEELDPKPDELDNIKSELNKLINQETIQKEVDSVLYNLNGGVDKFESEDVITKINESLNSLNKIVQYLPDLNADIERLQSALYEIEDISNNIDSYRVIDFDNSKLEELSLRQSKIQILLKKYGTNIDGLLEKKKEFKTSLEELLDIDDNIKKLENKVKLKLEEYNKYAKKLSDLRKDAALKLEKEIIEELQELQMENAVFKVEFSESKPTKEGMDDVQFLIKTNKGSDFKPLRDIISGGEMSRFMLALKNVLSDPDYFKTFVFDEIDSGLSGKVANAVGKRLENLSSKRQVLIISHLPQIISKADNHFKIFKKDVNDETVTSIKELDYDERINEVARLISGDEITKETLKNAELLIKEKRG